MMTEGSRRLGPCSSYLNALKHEIMALTKVKMLKTYGNRVKGFTYMVTPRFAGILIAAKLATEVLPKEEKEDKEAKERKTK
jgi:hypothetical protein